MACESSDVEIDCSLSFMDLRAFSVEYVLKRQCGLFGPDFIMHSRIFDTMETTLIVYAKGLSNKPSKRSGPIELCAMRGPIPPNREPDVP